MDQTEQRDFAEERYWREFCAACGTSPCGWDGRPDGFHTEFTEAELDTIADQLAIDILLLAFGLLGITPEACKLAYVLVSTSDAFAGDPPPRGES